MSLNELVGFRPHARGILREERPDRGEDLLAKLATLRGLAGVYGVALAGG